MRRAVIALLLTSSLGGCASAVKHPALTAGFVAGGIGMGTCELGTSEHATCAALSAGAGVGLGLVVLAALWLGYEDEPATAQPTVDPTNLEPAPVFVPTPDQNPTPAPAPPAPSAPEPTPPDAAPPPSAPPGS